MPQQDYIPKDDAGKCALFSHVASTLPQHFTALAITSTSPGVAQQVADAAAFDYVCTNQQTLLAAGQQATNAKKRLRDGDPLNPNVAVDLAFPIAPTPPSPVMPGVVARFRAFAKWLKSLPTYTEAIGESLQIVGDEQTGADLSTVKPVLPVKITGTQVEIDWGWGGLAGQLDAIEICVDRGTGTFAFLTIDTRPGYVDTEPLPATTARWRYKAIYRNDDARVGLWSDVVEIVVGG